MNIADITAGMSLEIEPLEGAYPGSVSGRRMVRLGFAKHIGFPLGAEWSDIRPRLLVLAITVSPTEPDILIAYYLRRSTGRRRRGWYTGPTPDDRIEA